MRKRTRQTGRTMRELNERLSTLSADAPKEEKEFLLWAMKMSDKYPQWRMEVRKKVSADVVVDPDKLKIKGGILEKTENAEGFDLESLFSMENPNHSLSLLQSLKAPARHRPLPTIEQLKQSFEDNKYFISPDSVFTIYQSLLSGRPLLVVGPSGSGKSELAKQIAIALGLDAKNHHHYTELFCTPDISLKEAFYQWNDAKRLLDLQLINSVLTTQNLSSDKVHKLYKTVAQNVYSARYLEIMPLLQACLIPFRTVRLIDELDKTYPTFDNLLLEILQSYSFEVPEYGIIGSPLEDDARVTIDKPLYIVVSNETRELSAMLNSRCILYISDYLPEKIEMKVINAKAGLEENHAGLTASFFRKIREMASRKEIRLANPPSTREAIATAQALINNKMPCSNKSLFELHCFWIKGRRDQDTIRNKFFIENEWKQEI